MFAKPVNLFWHFYYVMNVCSSLFGVILHKKYPLKKTVSFEVSIWAYNYDHVYHITIDNLGQICDNWT